MLNREEVREHQKIGKKLVRPYLPLDGDVLKFNTSLSSSQF